MATSPNDMETLSATGKALADQLEAEIDRKLEAVRLQYQGGNVSVDMGVFPGNAVINELRRRYLAVGWKSLTWNNDQKDGNSIILSRVSADDFWNR